MLFDTDILIWIERGHSKAARLVDEAQERILSVQSYMELLQGATGKKQIESIQDFLTEYHFKIQPLTENIGHRASIYIEEYALICGMRAGDALIAATAVENNLVLATANRKHFEPIRELKLHLFTA